MNFFLDLDVARLSDSLVASAMAVLGLALLAYAADLALRHRRTRTEPATAAVLAPASIGSSHDVRADEHAAPETAAADDPNPVDGASREPERMTGRAGTSLSVLGVGLLVAAVIARGFAAERAPWANMYEFALTGSASVGIFYLASLRQAPVRAMGVWVVGLTLLLLGLGTTVLYTPVDGIVPVLDSYWLVIHVAAAIIAGGLFTVGFVATAAQMVRARRRRSTDSRPPAVDGASDDPFAKVAHNAHLVAFPIWTFAVLAGAIWAENAWGRYWGWDPKETWAFITWVLYAAYLHAQATDRRWARSAGWLAIAGFLSFLFNFFGVNIWLPGLHSYAGV
ncbi:c-type cytochrome biogenesis protein CcsB [Nocardioides sp. ChNu-153]|uniref:c-type cytochrome biogenesis protein CcsB n=1 Tax=Nocardioides sp. ChNu-153 TaxID=2779364 RepID=UPI0026590898|nr:c-type cytochrome biogenesis protein CcsB [Nocardioides sp. ChNu-153]